jgi:molybdenum-dependent DNA-binding transcriptional regulator ModE
LERGGGGDGSLEKTAAAQNLVRRIVCIHREVARMTLRWAECFSVYC